MLCGWKDVNGANMKICQHKQGYIYCLKTSQCPPNSNSEHLEVKKLWERGRTRALDVPPNYTTAENQLVSPSSSSEACRAALGNLGLASGSHPAHKARVSLNLLPRPLLLSYSAVTQNVELFIQPDGKRVEKKKSVSLQERKVGHLDSSFCSTKLLGRKHYILRYSWPRCPISLREEDFSENSDRGVLAICILSNTWGSQT